jgi:hypothetical protein
MESRSIECERHVTENLRRPSGFLSNTGHVEPCTNLRGPSRKPKYYLVTDSELVPRGKGEKNRYKRSEIEPETYCLQGIGAPSI